MSIEDEVKKIIANRPDRQIALCDVQGEATLCDDLCFDSLDIVEILMDLEDGMDLPNIKDEVAEGWVTVQDVINTVTQLKG